MSRHAALNALALPFRTAPLLLVGIFSLLLALAANAGVLGIPAFVIVGSWFFKYAFLLLDHAAQGRPDAPVLTPEAANPLGEMRPLAFGVLVAATYGLVRAVDTVVGGTAATSAAVLALAALPAMLVILTITGSWAEALNPRTIAATTRRLGWGFAWIVCAALACDWLGRTLLLEAGHLGLLLRFALAMMLWLTLFSVVGGVIYDRRQDLGFEPEHSPERSQRRDVAERDRLRDKFIDQVFAEYRAGDLRNAWATVRERANAQDDVVAEYTWIYQRVASWPDPRLANQVAQELLPRLLANRRNGDALRILGDRLRADPHFRPASGGDVLALAQLARIGGDRPLARKVIEDFERRFPGDAARDAVRRLGEELAR